jgi:hypothetical protein
LKAFCHINLQIANQYDDKTSIYYMLQNNLFTKSHLGGELGIKGKSNQMSNESKGINKIELMK